MFADDIRRALQGTPRGRLAELAAAVWKGFACGAVSEQDAQQLAEEIAARKVIPPKPAEPRRRVGSRAKLPASVGRRRAWAASSWLPPRLASQFTQGEVAALAIVMSEIALKGWCELCHGAIAGRSGTSVSTVKRGVAEARRLGLIAVEVRRISRFRNDPNRITVLSAELRTWVATRGRGLRATKGTWGQEGGVQPWPTSESIDIPSTASASPTARSQGNRWGRKRRRSQDEAVSGRGGR